MVIKMINDNQLLEVRRVSKVFTVGGLIRKRKLIAVDDLSFSLPCDKPIVFTLAGESGSGKTTTALLILGFLKPTSGEILYKNENIWKLSKEKWRAYRCEVQAIFQDPYSAFNPFYRVEHTLMTPIKKLKLANSKTKVYDLIYKALGMVDLRPEILNKYPHQLSGGEKQRVMIARALISRPKLVVADEPVSMIDASLKAEILNLILNVKDKHGISFIYISHDLSTAYYISDKIAIMHLGSIVEEGNVRKIIEDPLHPYTKLLISSIPIPDPKYRWEKFSVPIFIENRYELLGVKGCKFYWRCPKKMNKCLNEKPKIIDVESDRKVACHLYGDNRK